MQEFNTDRLLICRLIFEKYSQDIEDKNSEKNIVADALSRLPLNGNQETTQKSIYKKEIVS